MSKDEATLKHKGFAFIEFEVPEAAGMAIEQMNGFVVSNRNLKVGRPSNAPNAAELIEELHSDPETMRRIYVASLHSELTEADIRTVFEAFGKVDECTLYPDVKQAGRHRGFSYIVFDSHETAIAAVSSMNGFDLAGFQLRVSRALSPHGTPLPFEPAAAHAAAKQRAAAPSAVTTTSTQLVVSGSSSGVASNRSHPIIASSSSGFSNPTSTTAPQLPPPGVFIPPAVGGDGEVVASLEEEKSNDNEHKVDDDNSASVWDDDDDFAGGVPLPVSEVPPSSADADFTSTDDASINQPLLFTSSLSRVLLLENMIASPDEVDSDLRDEVADECSNYGQVDQVLIHANQSGVRIFVRFFQSESSQLALSALDGRLFAGRTVKASLYSEQDFASDRLDS